MVSPFNPHAPSPLRHVTATSPSACSQSDQKVRQVTLPILAQANSPLPSKILPPMKLLPPTPEKYEAFRDYDLFQLMRALGYTSDDGGICAGLAGMGGQAILAGDFKTFEERFERIGRLIQKYKEQGGDLQEKIQKDKVHLEKDHDLMAFLDGIELYHQMHLYSNLSMGKMPTANAFVAKNLKKINAMGLSSKIQSEGGIISLGKITGFYTPNELIKYFELLKPLFMKEKTLVLSLDCIDHRIEIGYDKKEDSWILVDALDLTKRKLKKNEDIANAVYESLLDPNQTSKYRAIVTHIQATRKDSKALKKEIEILQSTKEFYAIHSLSPEKLDLINREETSFLDVFLTEPNLADFEFLTLQKINLNTKTSLGQTIIESATDNNNLEAVRLLLDKGADPNIANKKGYRPLDIAIKAENLQIAELLLEKGARPKRGELQIMLCLAIQKDNQDLAKLLIKYGAQVNASIDRGMNTPLRFAVTSGKTEMVKFLIAQGAFLHPYGEDKDLLFLSLEKYPEIFQMLIKNTTDVNVQDKEGNTLLAKATSLNEPLLVELLLQHGADGYKTNKEGSTPLHIAAQKGWDKIVSLLLPKSNLKTFNGKGKSALYLAREKKNSSTARILTKAGAKLSFFDRIKLFFNL